MNYFILITIQQYIENSSHHENEKLTNSKAYLMQHLLWHVHVVSKYNGSALLWSSSQPLDRPTPSKQSTPICWPMASSHPAWPHWSDATVLDDYAMTTTTTTLGGFPSKYRHPVWYKKMRMVWLPDGKKIWRYVCFDMIHERDRHRDRHIDTAWRHRSRLCIVSRGKNRDNFILRFLTVHGTKGFLHHYDYEWK